MRTCRTCYKIKEDTEYTVCGGLYSLYCNDCRHGYNHNTTCVDSHRKAQLVSILNNAPDEFKDELARAIVLYNKINNDELIELINSVDAKSVGKALQLSSTILRRNTTAVEKAYSKGKLGELIGL